MRAFLPILFLGLIAAVASCEPKDIPGGELTEIRLELVGKNPGVEGRYVLLVDERAALKGTGYYDSNRDENTENITLSLFWTTQPAGHAIIDCEQDDLGGSRVILEGASPGTLDVTAFTREVENSSLPCSPTPDGGWSFPDAGSEWPMQSEPITVEVR